MAKVYSEKKNISINEARDYLAPAQYEGHQYSDEAISTLVDNAINAINLFNVNSDFTSEYGKIEFPINFEVFANTVDDKEYAHSRDLVNRMNARINKLTNYSGDIKECEYFRLYLINAAPSNFEFIARGQFDYCVNIWGWNVTTPFPDPYQYLSAFEPGIESFGGIFDYLAQESMDDFRVNGNSIEKVDSLGNLRNLIKNAKEVNELNEDRYTKMALAEYELLEEMNIYKPRSSFGQGYILAVTNMTSVGLPKQMYTKINEGRLTGLWALEIPLTSEETQDMIEEEEEYKEQYEEEHPNGIYTE